MLSLILCDDDHFTLGIASSLLTEAIQRNRADAQIVCSASSGSELLHYIKKTPGPYLYFLDFDLGKEELNGIDLVKRIYQIDPDARIVFVTSHVEKGMDILRSGIRAFGFIDKTPDQEKMISEYRKYLRMAAAPGDAPAEAVPTLTLPIGFDETVELNIPDILYVDAVKAISHSICYHTQDGSSVTVRDSIEHAQTLLGTDFIRCHRSVLVNKKHVISLKNGVLTLSNRECVSYALGKKKEIMHACFSQNNL